MRVIRRAPCRHSLSALCSTVARIDDVAIPETLSEASAVPRVDFRRLGPWQEIRSALIAMKGDIRVREIAEAMNVLKRGPQRVPSAFLSELRDLVFATLDQLQPREACDILHSCIKLSLLDASLFTAIVQRFVDGTCSIGRLDNRGLGSLIYSIGQFERLNANGIPDHLMMALLEQSVDEIQSPHRLEMLDARTVITFLYGLGFLHSKFDVTAISGLTELCFRPETLAHLNEQSFSMLMSALQALQVQCSESQWRQLAQELQKETRRASFTHQGLINVLRRLNEMQFPYRDTLEMLVQEGTQPRRLQSYNGQDLANLIRDIAVRDLSPERYLECFEAKVVQPSVLTGFKDEELCNVIYSFALSRNEEKQSLFYALGKEAAQKLRLKRYTPQGLSMLVYSFGLVKFHDSEILSAVHGECLRAGRLKAFSEQSLANMVYGLGRLRMPHGSVSHFAEALLVECVKSERMRGYNEQGLVNLIYSLCHLKLRQFLDPLLEEACRPERLEKFTDQGLSNILQSLSRLESGHVSKIKILLTETVKRSREGQLSELATSNILTALMHMGFRDRTLLAPFFKTANRHDRLKKQSTEALLAVLERYARLDLRDYALINPIQVELSHKTRVQEMTNGQLVQILKLLWRLGMSSSKALPYFVKELSSEKRSLDADSMAEALITLAWLKYPDQQICAHFCQKLAADEIRTQLKISHLIQLLQAITPSTVPQESIEPFIAHLSQEQNLKQLQMAQLAELLQFHVRFGLRDEARVDRCLQEMTQKQRLTQLTLKDGSIALESVILMGMQNLESLEALVALLRHPSLLEHCRVHYVAKLVVSLCRLGPSQKHHILELTEKLTESPWSEEIAEKDLTEVLRLIKDTGYEYGKLGRLLNRRRRQVQLSPFLTE